MQTTYTAPANRISHFYAQPTDVTQPTVGNRLLRLLHAVVRSLGAWAV